MTYIWKPTNSFPEKQNNEVSIMHVPLKYFYLCKLFQLEASQSVQSISETFDEETYLYEIHFYC